MKVVALQLGFDNITLRNPGEEFDVPDSVFEGGGQHFFEPVDPADKERVKKLAKAARKAEVASVDPAKQAADYEASNKPK